MKAFIYAGGEIFPDGIFDFPKGDDVTVSADCGYKNAKLLGIVPQFAVGDFDSETQNEIPRETEIIEVPAEKDFTDTALAVDVALEQGADFIYIIGGLGGRLDHTMANLALLEKLWALGVRAYITDGKEIKIPLGVMLPEENHFYIQKTLSKKETDMVYKLSPNSIRGEINRSLPGETNTPPLPFRTSSHKVIPQSSH